LRPVACHQTVGDRIEAGTYLVIGALLGDPITVCGVNPAHLRMALDKLVDMGAEVSTAEQSITVSRSCPLRACDIQTLPYPGFPTDLQAQFTVLAALANGQSVVSEIIFEHRFLFAEELVRMGADIQIQGHFAYIRGVAGLSGAPVKAPDLRGGAALVIAGLVAEGQTEVSGSRYIDRGYEQLTAKLADLGAHISRQSAFSPEPEFGSNPAIPVTVDQQASETLG
jgi:UDP-N-acetylglucosamine 1-carboxyvinyltransferase